MLLHRAALLEQGREGFSGEYKVPLNAVAHDGYAQMYRLASGAGGPGVLQVVAANRITVAEYCHAMVRALQTGAKRGVNVACVGPGGCGKSALIEPLDKIYRTAPKPQAGSTFPLARVVNVEVMLWQDYSHDEATLRFTDLLAFFVGEAVAMRRPGQTNRSFRNEAPTFLTGRCPIQILSRDVAAAAELNRMMGERFVVFSFTQPLPFEVRQTEWKHCGRCFASFLLRGVQPQLPRLAPDMQLPLAAAQRHDGGGSQLLLELRELVRPREQGFLDDSEFQAAKRRLLS